MAKKKEKLDVARLEELEAKDAVLLSEEEKEELEKLQELRKEPEEAPEEK